MVPLKLVLKNLLLKLTMTCKISIIILNHFKRQRSIQRNLLYSNIRFFNGDDTSSKAVFTFFTILACSWICNKNSNEHLMCMYIQNVLNFNKWSCLLFTSLKSNLFFFYNFLCKYITNKAKNKFLQVVLAQKNPTSIYMCLTK